MTTNGSALVVLFSSDLSQVAHGYSREKRLRQLFGGLIDECDIVRKPDGSIDELATSRACALRELYEESGGLGESDLHVLTEFCEPRRWYKHNNPEEPRFQYPFIGVLREGVRLPRVDDGELIDLRFTTLVETLGAIWFSPESKDRLNPFHGIVVAKAITFLREIVRSDPRFGAFNDVAIALATNREIRLDSYAHRVHDRIAHHGF